MYYIRSGRRWRKLDPKTGTVEGWRQQPSFLYMQDDRLHLAPIAAVLRGLRALDAGRPTCIGIGDALPERRFKLARHKRRKRHYSGEGRGRRRSPESEVDVNYNEIDKRSPNTVSGFKQSDAPPAPGPCTNYSTHSIPPITAKETQLASSTSSKGVQTSVAKQHKFSEQNSKTTVQNVGRDESSETSSSSRDNYRELIIDEKDVELLRDFLVKNTSFIPNVDLHMYDEDSDYKSQVFYKINPLVRVERSRLMKKMLGDSQSRQNQLSLKDFATKLGLTRVTDVLDKKRYKTRNSIKGDNNVESQSVTDCDEDKENKKLTVKTKRNVMDKNKRFFTKHIARSSSKVVEEDANGTKFDSTSQPSDSSSCKVIKSSRDDVTSDSDVGHEIQRKTRLNITQNNTPQLRSRTSNSTKASSPRKRVSFRRTPDASDTQTSTLIKPFASNKPQSPILKSTSKQKALATKNSLSNKSISSTNNTPNSLTSNKIKSSTTKHIVKTTVGLQRPKLKRSSVQAGREYSGLEDHTIVTWISSGNARERLVNGNRVWRQLQSEYYRLSGVSRSWHSLRNRYLRYILPHLGHLALPPDQVARLRAAAATGEIKASKSRSPARAYPPVPTLRSAWSLRPRPRLDDTLADAAPTDTTPPTVRSLRSSATPKSLAPIPATASAPAAAIAAAAAYVSAAAAAAAPASRLRLRKLFNPNRVE